MPTDVLMCKWASRKEEVTEQSTAESMALSGPRQGRYTSVCKSRSRSMSSRSARRKFAVDTHRYRSAPLPEGLAEAFRRTPAPLGLTRWDWCCSSPSSANPWSCRSCRSCHNMAPDSRRSPARIRSIACICGQMPGPRSPSRQLPDMPAGPPSVSFSSLILHQVKETVAGHPRPASTLRFISTITFDNP